MGVAGESTGEILAHIAVGDFLGTVHQHLRTIIELRNTIDGQQQGQCLLQGQCVLAIAQKAVGVVVLDESHHAAGVRVEVVIDERAIEPVQSGKPRVGLFVLGLVEFVEEREVHHGLQIRVMVGEF